jgi:alpha-amylase
VIDLGGEPIKNTDYTWMGRVSEFRYGKFLSEVFRKSFGQKLTYLRNFGTGMLPCVLLRWPCSHSIPVVFLGWGMIPDGDAQIMIDNHDNQRGHG